MTNLGELYQEASNKNQSSLVRLQDYQKIIKIANNEKYFDDDNLIVLLKLVGDIREIAFDTGYKEIKTFLKHEFALILCIEGMKQEDDKSFIKKLSNILSDLDLSTTLLIQSIHNFKKNLLVSYPNHVILLSFLLLALSIFVYVIQKDGYI